MPTFGGSSSSGVPAPTQPPTAPELPELPEFSPYAEMSPEQRHLLELQIQQTERDLAMRDDIMAALEQLYGQSFATQYAEDLAAARAVALAFQQDELEKLDSRQQYREAYIDRMGYTPEVGAANQAAQELMLQKKELEVKQAEYAKWQAAMAGENPDPALARQIDESRQLTEERLYRNLGPDWASSQGGQDLWAANEQRIDEAVYRAQQDTIARYRPTLPTYAASPTPSLVAQINATSPSGNVLAYDPGRYNANILGYYSSPLSGALGVSQLLAQEQANRNQYNLGLYGTQANLYGTQAGYQQGLYATQANMYNQQLDAYYRDQAAQAQADANLWGSLIGGLSLVGGALIMSSARLKERIRPLTAEEREGALAALRATPVTRFHYRHDPGREHIGPILESSPAHFRHDEWHLSGLDYLGYLHAAVVALADEVAALRAARG